MFRSRNHSVREAVPNGGSSDCRYPATDDWQFGVLVKILVYLCESRLLNTNLSIFQLTNVVQNYSERTWEQKLPLKYAIVPQSRPCRTCLRYAIGRRTVKPHKPYKPYNYTVRSLYWYGRGNPLVYTYTSMGIVSASGRPFDILSIQVFIAAYCRNCNVGSSFVCCTQRLNEWPGNAYRSELTAQDIIIYTRLWMAGR